jgi:hypothetical protein
MYSEWLSFASPSESQIGLLSEQVDGRSRHLFCKARP